MAFESSFYTENGDVRIIRSEEIVSASDDDGRPYIDFRHVTNAADGKPVIITKEYMEGVTTIITDALDGEELPIDPVINIQFEAEMAGRKPEFTITQKEEEKSEE